jgi:hypothetical protein
VLQHVLGVKSHLPQAARLLHAARLLQLQQRDDVGGQREAADGVHHSVRHPVKQALHGLVGVRVGELQVRRAAPRRQGRLLLQQRVEQILDPATAALIEAAAAAGGPLGPVLPASASR